MPILRIWISLATGYFRSGTSYHLPIKSEHLGYNRFHPEQSETP